jgi:hypothetical protein
MASWNETTTYEQLQAMTPAERSEHFRSCIVLDPSTLSLAEQTRLAEMTASMREEILTEETTDRRAS